MIISFRDKETEKIWKQQYSRKLPKDIQRIGLRKLITDFHSRFNRHILSRPNYPQRLISEPGNLHFPVKFFNA